MHPAVRRMLGRRQEAMAFEGVGIITEIRE
jgi:hypothetical protein